MNNTEYRRFYLNDSKSRWIHVDKVGKKDTIVLHTRSGRLETRTCQYWGKFTVDAKGTIVERCKITYKGRTFFVNKDTVLED